MGRLVFLDGSARRGALRRASGVGGRVALVAMVVGLAGCNAGRVGEIPPPSEAPPRDDLPGVDGDVVGADGGAPRPESDAGPPPEPDPLGLSVVETSSRSVTVEWDAVPAASGITVAIGPEPARERGHALPLEAEVARLSGETTRHRIEGLAASVDVFVRVEVSTPDGVRASHLHARTLGGPRALRDDALREVQGFAPDVLRVTLTGGDGGAWQRGPWTVTRHDGSALAVRAVHRLSRPVGAPSYETRFGGSVDNSVVDVDHEIYLSLAEPIGSPELLRVDGPGGSTFTLPFSDQYLETPVLQVNQVGYNPRATARWAYVSGWMGDGGPLGLGGFPSTAEVLREPGESWRPRTAVVTGLPVAHRRSGDDDAGSDVHEIDLASVPAEEGARYRVRLPGVGVSWRTAVSERAAFKSFYVVTRGLFHNRWGGDLRPEFTEWSRPPDHPTVYTAEQSDFRGFFPESTPRTGARPLAGGYHDAGDFDQRPSHTVVAELLLRAYELNSVAFTDGQLTLPESGNAIPDLLDEALWGISGWEQLQEADGGVRMGVESYSHPPGIYPANEDELVYWTFAVNPQVTARVAGLFAQAARLVMPFDAGRSGELRTHAIDAYDYATSHGAKPAYRLYAAGELYRLTGEAPYRTAFESAWAEMGSSGPFSAFCVDHFYMGDYTGDLDPGARARAMPDYLLAYLGSGDADAGLRAMGESRLRTLADSVLNDIEGAHGHRSPRPAGHPIGWGLSVTTAKYMDPVIAVLQLGGLTGAERQRYFDGLSLAADYALGANPAGLVFFTGLGSRRVEEPLHLDSLVFIKDGLGPIPGLPVFGPAERLEEPWNATVMAQFYPSPTEIYAPGRRYGDVRLIVRTNEFTVWESQAPHTELFSVLLGPGMTPPASWLPGGANHRNPFP